MHGQKTLAHINLAINQVDGWLSVDSLQINIWVNISLFASQSGDVMLIPHLEKQVETCQVPQQKIHTVCTCIYSTRNSFSHVIFNILIPKILTHLHRWLFDHVYSALWLVLRAQCTCTELNMNRTETQVEPCRSGFPSFHDDALIRRGKEVKNQS